MKTGLTEGLLWEHQPGQQELSFALDLREYFCAVFFAQNYVFEWVWGEPVWWAAKLSLGLGIMSVERFH